MAQFTSRTKAYLMVLVITFVGAAACWYLLGQITKLQDDSELVSTLPVRHKDKIQANSDRLPTSTPASRYKF